MGVGAAIETDHVAGFRAEIADAAGAGTDALLRWFDNAPDGDSAFVRGAWDFQTHIATPLLGLIEKPWEKTALEIGCGGGRMTAAAARMFGRVIGIDIHEELAAVRGALEERGVRNATLVCTDGSSIPAPDASVDVVYSFIVLQHVQRISALEGYIRETARVLKPGGVCVLYAGRRCVWSKDRTARWRLWADRVAERFAMPRGYEEIEARVNETNLRVTGAWLRKACAANGMRVVRVMPSYRHVPDGYGRWGGQIGVVARKPA